MGVIIYRQDSVNAAKAARPTLRQHLKKEVFEAVERHLSECDIDRDDFGLYFDALDEAGLVGWTSPRLPGARFRL